MRKLSVYVALAVLIALFLTFLWLVVSTVPQYGIGALSISPLD